MYPILECYLQAVEELLQYRCSLTKFLFNYFTFIGKESLEIIYDTDIVFTLLLWYRIASTENKFQIQLFSNVSFVLLTPSNITKIFLYGYNIRKEGF